MVSLLQRWLVSLIIPRSLLGFTLDLLAISSSPIHDVSAQGWQKLHSEQLVRAACPTAAVLRVPLLYGPVESPLDSAPLLEYAMTIYDDLWWSQIFSNPMWTYVDPLGPLGMELDFGSASACCYYITVNYIADSSFGRLWQGENTPLCEAWNSWLLAVSSLRWSWLARNYTIYDLYHVVIQETEPLHRCVSA